MSAMSNFAIKRLNKKREIEYRVSCCLGILFCIAFWTLITWRAVDIYFK